MLLKIVLVLAAYFSCSHANTGEGVAVPPPDSPCRHVVARLVKRQLREMTTCINTMEFKNKRDRANKIAVKLQALFRHLYHQMCGDPGENCKLIIIMSRLCTRIAPDGKFDQAHADNFMIREIPPRLLPHAKPLLQKCFDLGFDVVDPTEEYCHSYKPTIKCVMDEVTKLCEIHD